MGRLGRRAGGRERAGGHLVEGHARDGREKGLLLGHRLRG